MRSAQKYDRDKIIELLSKAFFDNQSVGLIIGYQHNPGKIRALMAYCLDLCLRTGEVLITEDGHGCALATFGEPKATFRTLCLELKLIWNVIYLKNLSKILRKNALVRHQHPKKPFYYLWFIGVDPAKSGKGIGTELLQEVMKRARKKSLPIYLETSDLANVTWYEKNGFQVFQELDVGYRLYFMKC